MNRRWLAVLAVPGLLLVALLVDTGRDDSPPDAAAEVAASTQLTRLMPVASASDALSSTWYCAGGTATAEGAANQTVIVYNPTDRPTTGTITAVPSEGDPASVEQEVPPRGQIRLALTDLVDAPYASAIAEFRGGEVVVEHLVRGPHGVDHGPCASSASNEWHFASGTTTLDATEVLVLFNPFPQPATVDVAFALDGGRRRTPGALQGLQVPANSVVPAPVTVGPDEQLSATVTTRQGMVVADRIQIFNGEGPEGPDGPPGPSGFKPRGLAVTLGVPRPAGTWMFPFGGKDDGLHEKFVLYNPSDDEATVEVAVTLVDPEQNGEVDPFSVTVNPRSWTTLDLDLEDRIPTRVAHAAVVTARNEVPVVVERVVHSNEPLETSDVAISPGTPLIADRWIFAAGGSIRGQLAEWIAVTNPSTEPVDVQLGAVVDGQVRALEEGASFTLGSREHRRIRLPASLDAERVTVQLFADQPVAAERVLIRPEGARTSTAPGVPAGDGEVRLAPRTAAG